MQSGSKISRGQIRCWIEIIRISELQLYPLKLIAPKPPQNYEIRVIIWEVDEVDKDMSDMFCRVRIGN
jgi:hypothetical protein